jgi:hypothetical protein
LQGVVAALARWGLELMTSGPGPDDAVQPQWAALLGGLMLPAHLAPDDPEAQVVVGVESGTETMRVILRQGGFEIRRGTSPDSDVTLTGPAQLVCAVLSGLLSPGQASRRGLRITGARQLLHELVTAAPAGRPA